MGTGSETTRVMSCCPISSCRASGSVPQLASNAKNVNQVLDGVMARGGLYVFQQNPASSHKTQVTQKWRVANFRDHDATLTTITMWSPSSLLLNLLVYYVWGAVNRDQPEAAQYQGLDDLIKSELPYPHLRLHWGGGGYLNKFLKNILYSKLYRIISSIFSRTIFI